MMENKKNTILVPVDFSDISTHALNHAIEVAKHFNNNLALLHVIEEAFIKSFLSFGKSDQVESLAQTEVEERLNKMAADIKSNHNIDCVSVAKFGRIYKKITETAKELECDSIIMGSNGAAGFEQIIGSNASRVIGNSTVPVVVVKSDKPLHQYANIVFPLDLTIESRQKVKWAIHIGKAYQSTIKILTYKVNDEFLNIKMLAALNQVEYALEENDISYTKHIIEKPEGNFAEETLKYANEIDADLIMIMTQSEDKGFSEYIIGTYAQRIVNKSEYIPVMCINPTSTGISSDYGI